MKNAKSELFQALTRITGKGKDLLLDRDRRDQIHAIANVAKTLGFFDVASQCAHILAMDDGHRARLTMARLQAARDRTIGNDNTHLDNDTVVNHPYTGENEKTV